MRLGHELLGAPQPVPVVRGAPKVGSHGARASNGSSNCSRALLPTNEVSGHVHGGVGVGTVVVCVGGES